MTKEILFSGIQPTGKIHLGNYLGALKQWIDLQDKYNSLYCVVDLHALTIDQNPKTYGQQILDAALDIIALGLNPKKLFIQSHVPAHAELAWYFNTLTPMGEMSRMTQYKDKSQKNANNVNVGLFDYPVLMAADILLYHATVVPVGDDQVQHLELTNILVKKFNNKYGNTFAPVKPYVTKAARIMALNEPTKKMSKSLGDAYCLYLNDSEEIIRQKVSRAVTDSGPTTSGQMSDGVKNLFFLLELLGDKKIQAKLLAQYNDKTIKYSELKNAVADSVINFLKPFWAARAKLAKNPKAILKVLTDNGKRINKTAETNLKTIKQKIGLI